ncbi:RNA exonuclease 4 [Ascaphus truei]|uniref:RNA exonuclease 4 n=1 Tax=Ascaphus truei TaxID=8439 RepID=UPI003F59123E
MIPCFSRFTNEEAGMAKVKCSSSDSVIKTNTDQQTKKQKKKRFWKNIKKVAKKSEDKVSPLLLPKTPQDFSSNWKVLQELLKQKASSSAPSSTSSKVPRKQQKASDRKHEEPIPKQGAPQTNCQVTVVSPAAQEVKGSPSTFPTGVKDKKGAEQKRRKRKINLEETGKDEAKVQKKKSQPSNGLPTTQADLWFDDVDPDDIEAALGPDAGRMARTMQGVPENSSAVDRVLVKERAFEGLTKTVAMDCEMVGVGLDGEESILARVSIVNHFGKCVYDKYIKPTERVTNYRTAVSGIRPQNIRHGEQFKVVQKEVSEILRGRVLVGHAVHNDLKIFFLDHPKKAIRDTQRYKPFKQRVKCGRPSLKLLCEKILNVKVQTGEHCSIQDAQAAMRLYTMEKKHWEAAIKAKYTSPKPDTHKDKRTPK